MSKFEYHPSFIQFSGGRTSGYMLYVILKAFPNGLPEWVHVCFENTGKEREETLEFIRDIELNWGVKIVWLEYDDYFDIKEHISSTGLISIRRHSQIGTRYKIVNFESAARNGEPFIKALDRLNSLRATIKKMDPILPNAVYRICTANLKIKVLDSYIRDLGINEWNVYIGIRKDEEHRYHRLLPQETVRQKFKVPLVELGITKQKVNEFWDKQSFNLKLDPNSDEGNCDLCFLKATNKLITIGAKRPESIKWWADLEKKYNNTFGKSKISYTQLLQYIESNSKELDRLKAVSINDKTIDCFCGE